MRFLFSVASTINYIRQDFLKLCAVHTPSLPNTTAVAHHGFVAFSALLVLSASRNFMRALCN